VFRAVGVVGYRLIDHHLVYGAAFRLIAVEQAGATPALEYGGQLPAEIQRIADTHIHAVAAERRMQMAGVAREKHPPFAVAGCDELVRGPVVDAENLHVNVKSQRLVDDFLRFHPREGIARPAYGP